MSDFTNFEITQVNFLNSTVAANMVSGTPAVDALYANLISAFATVFNLQDDSSGTISDKINNSNPSYASQFASAISALNSVISSGVASQSVPGQTDYLTVQMVNAVSALYATFGVANINVNDPSSITNAQVLQWRQLANFDPTDMQSVVTNLVDASFSAQSEQAMVELMYVKAGNDLLSSVLQNMQKALNTTQDTLNTLNSILQLHNHVTVNDKIPFSQFFPSLNLPASLVGAAHADSFVQHYKSKASQYFNSPIVPTITISLGSGGAQFMSLKNHIASLIAQLSNVTPISSEEQANQTLLGQLKVVYADMQRALSQSPFNAPSTAFKLWILDNNDPANKLNGLNGGDIQQHITNAITGSESLNDTQKQDVQRYLFVFQEFYKSASAILTALTQIIQRMAQGISR